MAKIWDCRTGALVKELLDPEWTPDHSIKPLFEPNGHSPIIGPGNPTVTSQLAVASQQIITVVSDR
jgi:hypothetical protein